MSKQNHVIKIPIGDWSGDGHERCEIFEIESNYPVFDLQEAYKASCKLVGVQFHNEENFIDIDIEKFWRDDRLICTEYDDSCLTEFAHTALEMHGIIIKDILNDREYLNENSFTRLLLTFIGLSMPSDWEWEIIEDRGSYLNRFQNGNLNVQFGYGLFY